MKKSLYLFIGLLLGLGMTAYAATTVPLGKNGTSEYLLYPTDTLSAYTFIATSTTASSSFANGINLTNGCFAIGSVCLSTANIAESGNLYYTDSRVLTYLDTLSRGYFWSTTSADAWDATKDRWGTTSADYWYTLQSKASTTLLGDANTWSALQDFSAGLTASDVNTDSLTSHSYVNTFLEFTNTGASLNLPSTSEYLSFKNSTDSGRVNLRLENLTGAHDLYFPDKDGTFAMLSDITNASSTLYGDNGTFSELNQFAKLTYTNATGTNATSSSLAVSNLSAGLVKAMAGGSLVNAVNGTDYSLNVANTCGAGQHFNQVTAGGIFTCTADTGGGSASTTLYADFGTWTNTSQFNKLTFTNATGTNATTTSFAATTICLVGDTCRTTWPSAGGGVWPFTPSTNFGVSVQSTSTPLWFTGTAGVYASGTSRFTDITFVNATGTGRVVFCDLDGIKYADCFSGSDIGAKINAAYAACPSTGCTIMAPSGQNTFSTKIAFETNAKPVLLQCQQGSKMTWSGTGTSTVFNTGMDFKSERGMKGCYLYGPDVGVGGTTVGVQLGGTNGEPGVTLDGNYIIGFGKGIVTTKNIWDINIKNNRIQFNDRNIEVYSADNSGENFVFTGNNISDCSTVTKCVYFKTNGSVTSSWLGNVFDDAQLYFEDGNANINITGGGFENPNEAAIGRYTYIVTGDGGYSNMTITGTQFSNGASTLAKSPYQYISNGANLKIDNVTVQSFGSIESPAFVGNYGGGFWSGQVYEVGAAIVDISTTTSVGLVQLQNGRVGYGTTTPLDEVGILGNVGIYAGFGLNIYNADNTAYTTISRDDSKVHATWPWGFDDGATYGASYTNTLPPTGGLLVEGNTGIGTTSPYAKLSVQGTAGLGDAFAVASSTLSTLFNVTANGRVGIGSSTPWGTLSIIDSISGGFFPGVITATSTADMPYFGWTASTSEYAGSAVRIMAGNPSAYMSSGDTFDQFLLNGRVNTGDWKQMECAHDHAAHTAQITSDITSSVMSVTLGKPCGDFSYIEDANGVADFVVTTGSGYIRLRPGATGATVVAGDGMGLAGTTAFLRHATNTPVFLATARPAAVQNASTSIYMLGFSAATGVSADYATDAQNGCFFVASSTQANWQAVCRNTTATIVNTNVASSTVTTGDSAWRQFRIDMIGGPTPYAVFRIKQSASGSWGPPVATISTNIPTAVSLNPITSVGKVSAGLSPELHINRIRAWYNDPLWY